MAKKKKIVSAKTTKQPAKSAAKAKKPAKSAKAAKPVKKVAKKAAPKAVKPVKAVAKKAAPAAPAAKKAAPPAPAPKKGKNQGAEPDHEAIIIAAAVDAAPAAGTDEEAEEVVLTDAEGRRYCRVKDCDQLTTVDGYCRYHYLLYWKKIQVRKKILTEGKLERYIEELTARYPDKFLDQLRKDLRSEKDFLAAIQELEIDESANEGEFEEESQAYIDEVRGISESSPSSGDEEGF